ncbi:TspO/MBR family protein [Patescibacteria group bacterium]
MNQCQQRTTIVSYVFIPVIVVLIALLGGIITSTNMDWYQTLELPAITPPGFVFSVAWTLIYALAAWTAIIVWKKMDRCPCFGRMGVLFGLNALFNILWSYLFFGYHLIGWALIDAILLEIIVILLMIAIYRKVSKTAIILLVPYLIWGGFAIYINYLIWILN